MARYRSFLSGLGVLDESTFVERFVAQRLSKGAYSKEPRELSIAQKDDEEPEEYSARRARLISEYTAQRQNALKLYYREAQVEFLNADTDEKQKALFRLSEETLAEQEEARRKGAVSRQQKQRFRQGIIQRRKLSDLDVLNMRLTRYREAITDITEDAKKRGQYTISKKTMRQRLVYSDAEKAMRKEYKGKIADTVAKIEVELARIAKEDTEQTLRWRARRRAEALTRQVTPYTDAQGNIISEPTPAAETEVYNRSVASVFYHRASNTLDKVFEASAQGNCRAGMENWLSYMDTRGRGDAYLTPDRSIHGGKFSLGEQGRLLDAKGRSALEMVSAVCELTTVGREKLSDQVASDPGKVADTRRLANQAMSRGASAAERRRAVQAMAKKS